MRRIIFLLSILVLLLLKPQKSFASNIIFSDSFNDGLSNWQPIRDDGRYWSTIDGRAQAYIPFSSTITEIVPLIESGAQNLDAFRYQFKMKTLQGADKNISFLVEDSGTWYDLHFNHDVTELVKLRKNQVVWAERIPYIMQDGIEHLIQIDFIQGHIRAYIDNQLLTSTTDPTYQGETGTIGLKASTGGVFPTKIEFDDVVVTDLSKQEESFSLNIPLMKQTDPQWANLEYDTAETWINQYPGFSATFKDWACNLVSQVMILAYHGITQLPDGTELTPATYNQWLLNNNGYYFSPLTGNINRLSSSILSALVSEKLNTPKLEFEYISENIVERAIAEIEQGHPVILELDGHFVVADGFTADKTDLLIKDPAYSVTKLSEHPLEVKSLRLYTPSQTDLSYLTFFSTEPLDVRLQTEDGQSVPVTASEEFIRPYSAETTEESTGPITVVSEVVKPSSGTLLLTVNNQQTSSVKLSVAAYTEDGEEQVLLEQKEVTPGNHQYRLKYAKVGDSNLEPIQTGDHKEDDEVSFKSLKETIDNLSEEGKIRSPYTKLLLRLVDRGENIAQRHQVKIIRMLKTVVRTAPQRFISQEAEKVLLQQLSLLYKSLR